MLISQFRAESCFYDSMVSEDRYVREKDHHVGDMGCKAPSVCILHGHPYENESKHEHYTEHKMGPKIRNN